MNEPVIDQATFRWAISALVPVLTFWAGYRLGRRVQWVIKLNELLQVLRLQLRPLVGNQPPVSPPGRLNADTLHQVDRMLHWPARQRLRAAVARYDKARAQHHQEALGQLVLDDPQSVVHAAQQLLQLLAHRRF